MKLIATFILCLAAVTCNAQQHIVDPKTNTLITLTNEDCPNYKVTTAFVKDMFPKAIKVNGNVIGCYLNEKTKQFMGFWRTNDTVDFYTYAKLDALAIEYNRKLDAVNSVPPQHIDPNVAQANFEYNFLKNNPNWGMPKTQPYIPPPAPPVQVQCWNNGFGTVQCGGL